MATTLLDLLRRHSDHWLSIETLSLSLKTTPQDIQQQLQYLINLGYKIESSPIDGFRLIQAKHTLDSDILEFSLNTQRIGKKILVYQSTQSTNDIAWQHANEDGFDGLAVFAENQSKGRGRMGSAWQSEPGQSLLCSILLQSFDTYGSVLSLLTGLVTAEAIEQVANTATRIKWPNDIIIDQKKLAGTMVEARRIQNTSAYVLGIGINCTQEEKDYPNDIRPKAISLKQLTNINIDRVHLAQTLLTILDQRISQLQQGQTDLIHQAWLNRCINVGEQLDVIENGKPFSGRVIDISLENGLVLQLNSGPVKTFDSATTSIKKE